MVTDSRVSVLIEWYERYIGEPDAQTDIYTGFGLFFGGIALAIYYQNLLDYVIENISREVNEGDIEEGLDVPVVVTGGTSRPRGFENHLLSASIPFSISGVQRASEPLYSVARGALVAARSDEQERAPSEETAAADGGDEIEAEAEE
ncbi:hypothetical protein C497_12806 [Halalkalicoccus jeotgali B3]|uniref:Uncharacterized protein n=1 Tax=Halalkalicoccus jeotgali (strain DSM 18796 / CECT 7217 / JCM 14584 / KCTC 4019 / B3) TaxID=795797 RepID=D8J3Q0_HALJB|nr:hypothetical protein HacjB3_09870 [Halalkalicoccus jeotgali B3]ELY35430.1 hypothetical protein C497_12806 [Halalkalicoccus jeotgali B3]